MTTLRFASTFNYNGATTFYVPPASDPPPLGFTRYVRAS